MESKLVAMLERIGYNLLESHKEAIHNWIVATDTAIVERMVEIIDKNFKTPIIRGPVDQFFKNAEGDIEASLDEAVMYGFNQLEAALLAAAQAGGG